MKNIVLIIIVLLLAGDLLGAYFAFKAYALRRELMAFQGYLKNSSSQVAAIKTDFGGTSVYAGDNQKILSTYSAKQRKDLTVIFGASITKNWDVERYFPQANVINRGIGAQSDVQLLTRFSSDVLLLEPGQVVIKFCAGNFSPQNSNDRMFDEFEMMIIMAADRGIKPLLATVVPATRKAEIFGDYSISNHINAFNQKIRQMASEHKFDIVDYYAALADNNGYLPDIFATDDIHLNDNGYKIMAKVLKPFLY